MFKMMIKQFCRGLLRAVFSVGVSAILGLAVYGFVAIPTEGGYTAVIDFLMASTALAIALMGIYIMGGKTTKAGHSLARK